MKKIAMIMDGWKRNFTYAWPAGILERIREKDEDVNLYIFHSSGNWSKDLEYNAGEYNIYRLPNFDDFDGIILDLCNVEDASVREYVIDKAEKSHLPVFCICEHIKNFYYVGINNYAAMQEIIEHLYNEHNAKKYWFIMGSQNNYEIKKRVCGVKDFMDAHDISYEEKDFYFKDFEAHTGSDGFSYLYEQNQGRLPDAIICANDNIAVGVLMETEKRGISVPSDVLLTGFDDFDKARYFKPRISTVSYVREEIGYAVADAMIKVWNGEKIAQHIYTSTKAIFWESCGCKADCDKDPREYLSGQIAYQIESETFEEEVLSMEYEMMKCSNVVEMLSCIPQCIPSMKCDAMYLVADATTYHYYNHPEEYENGVFQNDQLCTVGYPEDMSIVFAYEDGKQRKLEDANLKNIFPFFDTQTSGKDMLFLPVHVEDRTIGYFVIKNAVYILEKQYLFSVMTALTKAVENFYTKEKLSRMNNALSDLSIKDAMTTLYNRLGFHRYAYIMFDNQKKMKQNMAIIYMDLDCLKQLNDGYGHDYGDEAIQSVAEVILSHATENDIPVRLGGDEFLFMKTDQNKEHIKALIIQMKEELKALGIKKNLPLPVEASSGFVITDWASELTLEEYVAMADQKMYDEKMKKKNKK